MRRELSSSLDSLQRNSIEIYELIDSSLSSIPLGIIIDFTEQYHTSHDHFQFYTLERSLPVHPLPILQDDNNTIPTKRRYSS